MNRKYSKTFKLTNFLGFDNLFDPWQFDPIFMDHRPIGELPDMNWYDNTYNTFDVSADFSLENSANITSIDVEIVNASSTDVIIEDVLLAKNNVEDILNTVGIVYDTVFIPKQTESGRIPCLTAPSQKGITLLGIFCTATADETTYLYVSKTSSPTYLFSFEFSREKGKSYRFTGDKTDVAYLETMWVNFTGVIADTYVTFAYKVN